MKTLVELIEEAERRMMVTDEDVDERPRIQHKRVTADPLAVANLDKLLKTPIPRPPRAKRKR